MKPNMTWVRSVSHGSAAISLVILLTIAGGAAAQDASHPVIAGYGAIMPP